MKISKKISEAIAKWNSPVYLTAEGLKKLQAKLERLKGSVGHLVSESARTAAYGDRSENEEYKDAKRTLRRTYRQISSIEDQLKRVVVIETNKNSGSVQLGSMVIVESKNGERKTFQILGPQESSPAEGRISNESPLGIALLGHSKGDTVSFRTQNGTQEYKIMDVS